MLVIRMQRTGRKGHAQFRVVVQDSRRTPTSGKIVAALGHFNPHTKETSLDKEKAKFYLEHGTQPSDRVARLLKAEGVKLPSWVELEGKKKKSIKNVEKLRRNRPAGAEAPKEAEPVKDVPEAEAVPKVDEPSTESSEKAETPAEEAKPEQAEEPEKTIEEPKTDEDQA